MKIFLMGLTSSGKSFQAKMIAKKLNLNHMCGSVLLLDKLNHDDTSKEHWWFTDEGKQVDAKRDNSNIDKEIDDELLKFAQNKNNFIMESWTTPFLYNENDVIKIYLNPPAESRIKMALSSKEDKRLTDKEILKGINYKDSTSRKRFENLYGIDIYDTSGFDLIIDNSLLKPSQTNELIVTFLSQARKQF